MEHKEICAYCQKEFICECDLCLNKSGCHNNKCCCLECYENNFMGA